MKLRSRIAFAVSLLAATSPAVAGCYIRTCTDVTITKVLTGTMGNTGEVDIVVSGSLGLLDCVASDSLLNIDTSKPGADAVVAQALTQYALGKKVTVRLEEVVPTCVVRWIVNE